MPYATSGGHNPSRRSSQASMEAIQMTRSGQRFQIPQERTAASRVANYNRESLTNRYQGYAASRESPRNVNNIMNAARQKSMQDYYERLNKINNM
jgi:hypothetical protein